MTNMIKKLRKIKGWSQETLADKMKWHQVDISRAENSKVGLTEDEIRQFTKVFDVSADEFLGLKTGNHPAPAVEAPKTADFYVTLLEMVQKSVAHSALSDERARRIFGRLIDLKSLQDVAQMQPSVDMAAEHDFATHPEPETAKRGRK